MGISIGGTALGVFRRLGITGNAAAILMILSGVLIIVFPWIVAYVIGLYLIVAGVLILAGHSALPGKA
ncbi:MAG TPA: hypothetical protein VF992_05875 [Thermoplasmata archaeon]